MAQIDGRPVSGVSRRALLRRSAGAVTIPPLVDLPNEHKSVESDITPPYSPDAPMPTIGAAITILGSHSRPQALANLAEAGVEYIRYDFLWERIEPEPGTFTFDHEETVVEQADAAGLETRAILAYGNPHYSTAGGSLERAGAGGGIPPFGVGSAHYVPPDAEHLPEYRRFARTVADHFAGRVDDWEVWNEENVGVRFWPPKEDPAAYASLLRAGATGLRSGNAAATVSSGGVFYPEVPPGVPFQGGRRFLRNVYAADPAIGDAVDAVAWHPYQYPFVAPEVRLPGNSNVPGSADQVGTLLEGQGDGHLDRRVTELGWPTHDPYGVPERRQAAYLARAFLALWAKGVDTVVWYTYADGPNARDNQEDAFGLVRFDGTEKPSYRALRTLTSVFDGLVFQGSRRTALGLDEDVHAFGFERAGPRSDKRVTALWTSPEGLTTDYGPFPRTTDRREVALDVRGSVERVSMEGDRRRLTPDGGAITVEISPFPVYVVERGA